MGLPRSGNLSRDQVVRALSNLMDGIEDPGPRVILPTEESALWEPTDSKQPVTVASIATTANGGEEVKFAADGVIIPGPGAMGMYWARSVKARWAPLTPGRPIPYTVDAGFFVGRNTTGVATRGVLSLEFYAKPSGMTWGKFMAWATGWTKVQGAAEGAVGGMMAGLVGMSGTDVTLGTFSHLSTDAAKQIFLAGSAMPEAGADQQLNLIVKAPYGNTDEVYVGETAALAVASNNPLSATGEDTWSIPSGGKLFFKSASGTQKLSARIRA